MDVRSLKTLHAFANVLGIIPTYKTRDQDAQKASTFSDKVKAVLLILTFAFIFGYNIYGKVCDYGQHVEHTILLVNTLSDVLVTLINITCLCKLNLKDGKKLLRFLQKLQSLESFIVNKNEVNTARRKALIEFCVVHLLGVLFGCFSAFVFVRSFGFEVYKYLMMREFQNSHFLILMHMIICHAELIGLRMSELNVHLKQQVRFNRYIEIDLNERGEREAANNFLNGTETNAEKKLVSVELISEAYIRLAELVEEGNDLFGTLVLLFCANMTVNIMVPVNMCLLYFRGIPLYSQTEVGVEFIGYCLFWVIFPILIGGKLMCVNNKIENEANNVPRLCYTLMNSLGNDESKLRSDLDNYASQADRMKIKFSAGGFFDVNLGLMMPIVGSVFTYLIVLMQFHNL